MRKSLALLALLLLPCSVLFAQDVAPNSTNSTPPIVKAARDFVMLQFNYNNWAQKPDSVKNKQIGYGFNAFLCYDFPIKKTKLSFAPGLGINTSVVYLDQQSMVFNDTGSSSAVRFTPEDRDYKRYKFVTTYLQAPFELRYSSNTLNRNKGFKAAIGLQVGTLLGAHTKGTYSEGGSVIKEKEDTKRYVSPWNFAATVRVGYGNFSLFASYNLTNVFRENQGPVITPFSAGICLTGL